MVQEKVVVLAVPMLSLWYCYLLDFNENFQFCSPSISMPSRASSFLLHSCPGRPETYGVATPLG